MDEDEATQFAADRNAHGIDTVVVHDSYLINLATPKPDLREKSYRAWTAELRRCVALGVDYLVSHPGNATDGNRERGLEQNAELVQKALEEVGGDTVVAMEITGGQGNVLGCTFEELARFIDLVQPPYRDRIAITFDTCHAYVAGYDLVGDYDGVMAAFDDVIGLDRLKVLHLNDSEGALGSNLDRHAHIGEGALGADPFRRLMTDPAVRDLPALLETPKGDNGPANDRRNLALLRGFRTRD